jgi:hypothetical protein
MVLPAVPIDKERASDVPADHAVNRRTAHHPQPRLPQHGRCPYTHRIARQTRPALTTKRALTVIVS